MKLFHYCSIDKFVKILDSKKIWLTPVQAMNDRTEIDHLFNMILPSVRKRLFDETPASLKDDLSKIFHFVDINTALRKAYMPYCACFSKSGDILSQWCMYANQGNGVSIGFEANYFNLTQKSPCPQVDLNHAIAMESIEYNYKSQELILYEEIKKALAREPQDARTWMDIIKTLTIYSAKFKNRTFSVENEKRIIYYFAESHSNQFKDDFISGPYKYGDYDRFELSWYKAPAKHAIKRIVIGPKCSLSRVEVLNYLENYDIHISENQIVPSESSYR